MVFRLGRLLPRQGPRARAARAAGRPDGAGGPAHGDAHGAAAGGDHARQRAGPGGGRLLLPRGRPRRRDHGDRGLRAGHVADRPDHPALGARAEPTSTSCSPSATGSTTIYRRSSTSRPSRGGSRSRPSRSRTSRSRRRCSAPWRARPRPSASAAPRSSTPRASSRPPRSSPRPAAIIGREPSALQLRYLQTLLEVGADQNSTIVFPLPLDLLKPFLERAGRRARSAATHLEELPAPERPRTDRPWTTGRSSASCTCWRWRSSWAASCARRRGGAGPARRGDDDSRMRAVGRRFGSGAWWRWRCWSPPAPPSPPTSAAGTTTPSRQARAARAGVRAHRAAHATPHSRAVSIAVLARLLVVWLGVSLTH